MNHYIEAIKQRTSYRVPNEPLGGKLMKPKFYENRALYVVAFALIVTPFGCGEDPGMYQGEVLTFETPVSSKEETKEGPMPDLDLLEKDASDFGVTRIGAFGWSPFPVFDYFLEPIPVEVPVAPGVSLIEFLPPMYWNFWDRWFFDDCCFDHHRFDDDDHHRRRDDD